jgi:hypothetical protein
MRGVAQSCISASNFAGTGLHRARRIGLRDQRVGKGGGQRGGGRSSEALCPPRRPGFGRQGGKADQRAKPSSICRRSSSIIQLLLLHLFS